MIETGWDWPTLMATPADVVEEYAIFRDEVGKYVKRMKQNG